MKRKINNLLFPRNSHKTLGHRKVESKEYKNMYHTNIYQKKTLCVSQKNRTFILKITIKPTRCHFTLMRMLTIKKKNLENRSVGEGVDKLNP